MYPLKQYSGSKFKVTFDAEESLDGLIAIGN